MTASTLGWASAAGDVHRHDPGVRQRAAQDRAVQHARQLDVVHEQALAADEPRVLLAAAAARRPCRASARSARVRGGHDGTSPAPAAEPDGACRPTGSSGRCSRSRCTGRSGPRWPRGSAPRDGSGWWSSSQRAVIIMPGVQNPHCRPWHCAKPSCTGSSCPRCSSPSTVQHPVAVGHRGQHGARLHRGLVQPDHAGPAVGGVAAPVRPGQPQLVAQEVDQQQPRLDRRAGRPVPLT